MICVVLFTILFIIFSTELLILLANLHILHNFYIIYSFFVFYIKGGMIHRRKPTQADLQQAHIAFLHRVSSPMYGNRRCAKTKPQRTQPI